MPRPFGSRNKPKFADNVSIKERAALIQKAIELAKKGDVIMLRFILEQIFGKAPLPLTGGGNDDKPIAILNYVFSDNGNAENNKIKKKNKNLSGRDVSVKNGVNNSVFNTLGTNR